jgi:putative flippase GtrA
VTKAASDKADEAPPGGLGTKAKSQAAELARFVVVGSSAVGVDFLVYFALIRLVPVVPTSVAKGVSFMAGAILAFILNRGFVFRSDGKAKQQVLPFVLLYLFSLALNNGVNAAMLAVGAHKVLAWFFATGSSTVSNFLGMKLVVFRKKKES